MGAKGAGTWWCHFGYLNNLAGPILAKRCSICWGSCSICLLMSTVVGGTHVYHVMRRAGSTFTWRSDHRGKWQPPWQMFSQSWGESHGRPVQSEGLDISPATTATTCVCLSVHPACTENKESALFFKTILKWQKRVPSVWLGKDNLTMIKKRRQKLYLQEEWINIYSTCICLDR